MASTYDPSHPFPIIATQEGIAQQTFAHAYDAGDGNENGNGKAPVEEKSIDEKVQASTDVEVAVVEDGDVIRESGMLFVLL